MPVVSVIMSVYREPVEWMRQAIDSILGQTFSDFEFIIVNDCPERNDNDALLAQYQQKDKRIVLLRNEKNIGLTRSLNRALRQANGRYVARMDADDISRPQRLERQVALMDNNADVIVCGTRYKNFGHRTLLGMLTNNHWVRLNDNEIKAQLLTTSCFVHPTVIIRRDILTLNNIEYDENYRTAQDYRMWEQLRHFGKYANLKEELLWLRISKSQISSTHGSNQLDGRTAIRKRCIVEWLESCGLTDLLEINDVAQQRKMLLKVVDGDRHNPYFRSLMQTLYYSNSRHRLRTLLQAIATGDIFFYNNAEKLRFIAICLSLKANDKL